ncbi:MAG: tRNA pseudouridine(55) synthase TruB [Bacteroidales bacterium]|nr:tRNA pseudouridine(55) synthase TruB [Bacteroidales bacterium]
MTRSFSHSIEDYPDGIVLPVDKPYRWTSADVIRKIKYAAIRHFGKKNLKVGHAGTLDPLATGILLVCIGPATRRAEALQGSPKEYIAGVSFGATTPSYDLEKEIDRRCPLDGVSEAALCAVLPGFVGEQDQVAPLFSAKSVDGVRAYETARRLLREAQRAGRPFDPGDLLQSNRITISELELLSWSDTLQQDFRDDGTGRIRVASVEGLVLPTARIRVACSKGTYIRALARDLGEALGSGAFLSSLRRTKNGGFGIEDAVSLEAVLEALRPAAAELPLASI